MPPPPRLLGAPSGFCRQERLKQKGGDSTISPHGGLHSLDGRRRVGRSLSGTGLLTASTVCSQVQSGLPGDLGQAPSLGLSCAVGLWVMQEAGCSGPGYMGPRLFTARPCLTSVGECSRTPGAGGSKALCISLPATNPPLGQDRQPKPLKCSSTGGFSRRSKGFHMRGKTNNYKTQVRRTGTPRGTYLQDFSTR